MPFADRKLAFCAKNAVSSVWKKCILRQFVQKGEKMARQVLTEGILFGQAHVLLPSNFSAGLTSKLLFISSASIEPISQERPGATQ